MTGFAISLAPGLFVGVNFHMPPDEWRETGNTDTGWRPFRWVRGLGLAEIFGDEERAQRIGAAALGHGRFEILPVSDDQMIAIGVSQLW